MIWIYCHLFTPIGVEVNVVLGGGGDEHWLHQLAVLSLLDEVSTEHKE